MSMPSTKKRIRDFVYLDEDRLYSLYSQVFEGVAERIVESYAGEMWSGETKKTGALTGETKEAKVAEVTRKTENKLLYDHMYSMFDHRVGSAIVDLTGSDRTGLRDKLRDSFLIKVNGGALVEDYERLYRFAERFNDLGETIAYARIDKGAIKQRIEELERKKDSVTSREDKRKLQEFVDLLKDPKKFVRNAAQEEGLYQDELVLKNIRLWIEMFYLDEYEIVVTPRMSGAGISYRGVIDRRWLRIDPKFLRVLYAGKPALNWTMVGQVAFFPDTDKAERVEPHESGPVQPSEPSSDADEPSMRDPFRRMFNGARAFETMMVGSKEQYEVVIAPLAIYREVSIDVGE